MARSDSKPVTSFTGNPAPATTRPARKARRKAAAEASEPTLDLAGKADRVTIERAKGGWSVRATREDRGTAEPWKDETAVATTTPDRDRLVDRFLGEEADGD